MTWPVIAWGCTVEGEFAAIGGLSWRFGRCDIWLTVLDATGISARVIVREAKRMLSVAQQMGEPAVFCIRDDHPGSKKLLRLCGLAFDHVTEVGYDNGETQDVEVWSWRPSPPLLP